MAYEYLLQENQRAKKIAEWLNKNNLVKDRNFYDLNCGVASLVKEIDGFKNYEGNDVSQEYIDIVRNYKIKNTQFDCVKDSTVWLPVDCILIYMGCDPVANPTGLTAFMRLVINDKPEVVVFEATDYFEKKYGIFTKVNSFMKNSYILDCQEKLKIESKYRNVRERTILYFRRRI